MLRSARSSIINVSLAASALARRDDGGRAASQHLSRGWRCLRENKGEINQRRAAGRNQKAEGSIGREAWRQQPFLHACMKYFVSVARRKATLTRRKPQSNVLIISKSGRLAAFYDRCCDGGKSWAGRRRLLTGVASLGSRGQHWLPANADVAWLGDGNSHGGGLCDDDEAIRPRILRGQALGVACWPVGAVSETEKANREIIVEHQARCFVTGKSWAAGNIFLAC